MLSLVGAGWFPPPPCPTWCGCGQLAFAVAQQKPASSRRDDGAALAALVVQALPGAIQALLRLPADRNDVRWLAGLAALEHGAVVWCASGRLEPAASAPVAAAPGAAE